jgi:hypothetical protein
MKIDLHLDTNDPADAKLIDQLFGRATAQTTPTTQATPASAPEVPKPPKKAAAAPKPPLAAVPDPEPEPEVETTAEGGYTQQDAVRIATDLVSAGNSAKVKDALAAVGAKRVSEVGEDQLPEFIDALRA